MKGDKGGRPRKCQDLQGDKLKECLEKNVLKKHIGFYISEYEYKILMKKYKKLKGKLPISKSDFFRNIVLEKDFKELSEKENRAELIKNINKIGVNINQLVKTVNSHNYIDNTIINEVKQLENLLKEILEIIYKY